MILDGAMHGTAFLAYVEQVLAPTLSPGDIVIMDNLPAHKPLAVRHAIEATGADLHFLPPYSPDFNPIEMAFSKLKAFLKSPPPEPSTISATPSHTVSRHSHQKNAKTTSPPQDMTANDR